MSEIKAINELDDCIVWNAHNTVFGSKRSAICAQAVYILHSTRPSVTWDSIVEGDWLPTTEWCQRYLPAMLSNGVGRRRIFGEVSCTKCTNQWNASELIPVVKMENKNLVEGYFSNEFPFFL